MSAATETATEAPATGGFPVGKLMKFAIPAAIGIVIAMLPQPDALEDGAMIFLGVFATAILWLIFDVIDDYIVTTVSLAAFVLLGIVDFNRAFSPFSGQSVWLVIGAFAIAAVIAKVGLLRRVAFKILSLFPETYRGQTTAVFATGTVIAPLIPSLTAKAAILGSFAAEASEALGFKKGSKAATGFFTATWISTGIIGMAFLSGAVPVFTILGFLPEERMAEFSWVRWFVLCVVWLVVMLVLSYVAVLYLYSPSRHGEEMIVREQGFAKKMSKDLGPMSRNEKIAGVFLALALAGWILGDVLNLSTTIWALIIMACLAALGLLTKKDFVTRIPWSTVYFIGGVFALASLITHFGVHTWLAGLLGPVLEPVAANPYVFVPMLVIGAYLMRYVIISQTATTAIFFAALGGVAAAAGMDQWVLLFVVYVSTLVWHFAFTNVTFVAALGATGDKVCTHRDTLPMNWAFMGINLVACMASIPLWQGLGMIS